MVFTRFNCNIVTIGFSVDKMQNCVLFRILVVVSIQQNSFPEQFKPYIPVLQDGVKSQSRIYNNLFFLDQPQIETDYRALKFLCMSACANVKEIFSQHDALFTGGFMTAFARFSDGLFATLDHLIATNNLNRTAFKNLIKPMAVLIHTISRLTGDDDTNFFSFGNNPLDFNVKGEKIRFQNQRKHAELISKVKESSKNNQGCPMRHVDLDVDLDGTGNLQTVNIIKVLYYLCARQVEMALFGRETETPA